MKKTITLDKFTPRWYQLPVIDALEKENKKRMICVWPRRAGKDIMAFNIMIRQALKRVGVYYYIFPRFSHGRSILWEAITNDGFRVIDYIPQELVYKKNEATMKIELINGSIIKVMGSDNYDKTLIGTNVCGAVFSEYAVSKPDAWDLAVRPILSANDGWAMFVSTPRGKNWLYELFVMGENEPERWYTSILTVDQTQHIPQEQLEQDRKEMSEDKFLQEYYCSFDCGAVGVIYDKYINKARLEGRVGEVPWDPMEPVHTAWDIGLDTTSIVFFQVIGTALHVIDYYESLDKNLHEYAKLVLSKEYLYGKHLFPHDGRNRSWEADTRYSRQYKAEQLGLKTEIVHTPGLIEDAIEHVRLSFNRVKIDEGKCKQLINCLDNYRREWDSSKRMYSKPVHNWASHGASAFMIMCLGLEKVRKSMTQEDADRIRQQAHGTHSHSIAPVFHKPFGR